MEDGNIHVERILDGNLGGQWKVVSSTGWVAGPFDTNAEAWRWIDRNTNEGGDERDHAGRQDWSIRQRLKAE